MLTKNNMIIGTEWCFGPDWPVERCTVKTRRGTACLRPANKKNGRCRGQYRTQNCGRTSAHLSGETPTWEIH